jgi:hypothetical protein
VISPCTSGYKSSAIHTVRKYSLSDISEAEKRIDNVGGHRLEAPSGCRVTMEYEGRAMSDLVSPMWVKDSDFSEDGKFANSLSTSIR